MSCGIAQPGAAGIPLWLIILIAAIAILLIAIIGFVALRRKPTDDVSFLSKFQFLTVF